MCRHLILLLHICLLALVHGALRRLQAAVGQYCPLLRVQATVDALRGAILPNSPTVEHLLILQLDAELLLFKLIDDVLHDLIWFSELPTLDCTDRLGIVVLHTLGCPSVLVPGGARFASTGILTQFLRLVFVITGGLLVEGHVVRQARRHHLLRVVRILIVGVPELSGHPAFIEGARPTFLRRV